MLAKAHFEAQGYTVEATKMHGPDLVISRAGYAATVEVKTASQVKGRQCWFVNKVHPTRVGDDLIAFVFQQTGRIIVLTMKEHLAECGADGRRVVTKYV